MNYHLESHFMKDYCVIKMFETSTSCYSSNIDGIIKYLASKLYLIPLIDNQSATKMYPVESAVSNSNNHN